MVFALKNRYWLLFLALLIVSMAAIFNLSSCAGFLVIGSDSTSPSVTTTSLPQGYSVSLLYKKTGVNTSDFFGRSVSSAGDLDGDGKSDFAVGENRSNSPGYAHLYSGADGSSLAVLEGNAAIGDFGYAIISGDLDGDGKPDLVISDPSNDYISIFYGNDLYNRTALPLAGAGSPGNAMAYLGDINGDGGGDFIFGDCTYSPLSMSRAGRAVVISGKDRSILQQKLGPAADMQFGWSVASAGDVNGDGTADYLIGAPDASPSGVDNAGSVYVYSGSDGALLFQKDGAGSGDQFGFAVAGLGDINGDGRSDYAVGAPLVNLPGKVNVGLAYVYSGADGALLYQLSGEAERVEFGTSLSGLWDIDGDGKNDFAVGAPKASPNGMQEAGSVYVYSGADGSFLCRLDGESGGLVLGKMGDRFGRAIAPAGDVNGDGKPDIIIGTYEYNPIPTSYVGAAYVYSILKL